MQGVFDIAAWPVHGWKCSEDGEHHSFAGARCVPAAQWCFCGSSCRIWHWASQTGHWIWIPIRLRMQREGAHPWLSHSTSRKNISQSTQKAEPTPAAYGSKRKQLPHRATGNVAGGTSSSRSRGWQAGVAEAESSIIQNPSWVTGAFSSRIVWGTV